MTVVRRTPTLKDPVTGSPHQESSERVLTRRYASRDHLRVSLTYCDVKDLRRGSVLVERLSDTRTPAPKDS